MKMLCCYDETGRISNLIFEPIPATFSAHYEKLGIAHCLFDNPNNLSALQVANGCYVVNGAVVSRPECPATVALDGRVLIIDKVPGGSTVTLLLNVGSVLAHREVINDFTIEFDEPGLVEIQINPPWPMIEEKYRAEIQ